MGIIISPAKISPRILQDLAGPFLLGAWLIDHSVFFLSPTMERELYFAWPQNKRKPSG